MKFVGNEIGKYNISVIITPRGGQRKILETTINVVEPNLVFSA